MLCHIASKMHTFHMWTFLRSQCTYFGERCDWGNVSFCRDAPQSWWNMATQSHQHGIDSLLLSSTRLFSLRNIAVHIPTVGTDLFFLKGSLRQSRGKGSMVWLVRELFLWHNVKDEFLTASCIPPFFVQKQRQGCLGGSSHDLRVLGSRPALGFLLSVEPASPPSDPSSASVVSLSNK